MGEGSAIPTDPQHTSTFIEPSTSQPKKTQKPKKPKRKDTEISQPSGPTDLIADETILKEKGGNLVRATTTASSLEVKHDSSGGNISKAQSKATPNEPSSPRTSSGGGLRCQDTIRDIIAQTRFENIFKQSSDPLLAGVEEEGQEAKRRNMSRTSGLKRLYKIGSARRVEPSDNDKGLGEKDAPKQGRIAKIDVAKDIYLVNVHHDEDMFGVNDLEGNEVFVESEGVVKTAEERINVVEEVANISEIPTVTTADDLTLDQVLAELKSARPSTQGISFREPSEATTTTITTTTTPAAPKPPQDKGKGIMIEEPVVDKEKPMKKQEQMRIDEELAFKLQAKEEEVERLARIEVDEELATRLQAEEQEQFTDAEKARLFCEFLDQRRKFFAAKRAKAKRNKPPTQANQRKLYCRYLMNMEGYTLKQLKGFKFEDIQKMFDRAFKRVNTFVDYKIELLEESSKKAKVEKESSSKRAGEELESENSKK
ncbi:hypothetical protein Tco_0804845 [Tanacetum coccineum]